MPFNDLISPTDTLELCPTKRQEKLERKDALTFVQQGGGQNSVQCGGPN